MFAWSPIVGLLLPSGPATILGRIGAVVIDTFERQLMWAISHIRKEVFKVQPPFADFDASCSVPRIGWATWVATPLDHAGPAFVRFCSVLAMRFYSFSGQFNGVTATRCGIGLGKVTGKNPSSFATVTLALPFSIFIRSDYRQPAESFTSQINQESFPDLFRSVATTGNRKSSFQVAFENPFYCSAITLAPPSCESVSHFVWSDDTPSAKALINQIQHIK